MVCPAKNPRHPFHGEWKERNTMVYIQAQQTGRSLFISTNTCNQYKYEARSVILCLPPRCWEESPWRKITCLGVEHSLTSLYSWLSFQLLFILPSARDVAIRHGLFSSRFTRITVSGRAIIKWNLMTIFLNKCEGLSNKLSLTQWH